MATNGSDVLIYVYIAGVKTAVGSQREASIEETNEEIDISTKDLRAKRVLPGRYSSTISLDSLYVPSDSAYSALKTAMRNGTAVVVATETEYANAIVTSLSESYPDQDAATVSIGLSVSGEWTVGAPA